jgi:nicotinamide riboside kinase
MNSKQIISIKKFKFAIICLKIAVHTWRDPKVALLLQTKFHSEMLKIILTGPESCGKTTLARQLAVHFNAPLVEEYAREFFEKKGTPQYKEADLTKITIGQINAENKALEAVNQQVITNKKSEKAAFLICDTDVLTIKIWSEEKYGRCDEWIIEQVSNAEFQIPSPKLATLSNFKLQTIYLLCSPEGMAWEADPLRENPNDRARLFDIYEENLQFYEKNYFILRGPISERFAYAKAMILELSTVFERF